MRVLLDYFTQDMDFRRILRLGCYLASAVFRLGASDMLAVRIIPLAHLERLVFREHRCHAHVTGRQAARRLASGEQVQRFLVEVGNFQQGGKSDVEGPGDRFHDLERRIGLAVGQVGQERHRHARTVGQFVLGDAQFVEHAQDVGEEDLVVHGG